MSEKSTTVFPITAGQYAFPFLHNPYDIMFMEMAWKRLADVLKTVRFHPYFFLHADCLLSVKGTKTVYQIFLTKV